MTQIVTEPELKPKKAVHNLVKYIKAASGLSMGEFCEKELKTDYKAFNWRLKKSRLYPDEIIYMLWRTKRTVQELFGKDWHELIIDNSSGPVVAEVKQIMGNMSKAETRELERLIGLEPYKAKAKERNAKTLPKKAQEVADRLKGDKAKQHPVTPEEVTPEPPKPEPQAPETPEEDPFKKIFKDTYGAG